MAAIVSAKVGSSLDVESRRIGRLEPGQGHVGRTSSLSVVSIGQLLSRVVSNGARWFAPGVGPRPLKP